jgi:hypothetical protein
MEGTMTANEILYISAYCIFLAGASKSFRENGSSAALWVMGSGVLLDFLLSMLPVLGVQFLSTGLKGTNAVLIFAIVFGFVVWLLFLAALIIRKKGNMPLFHLTITLVEITWFIDFVAFLYGLYKFPLT